MTDGEWLKAQEEEMEAEYEERKREEWLLECRRQPVVTQEQLQKLAEDRWQLEWEQGHPEEVLRQVLGDYEEQLRWDERCLRAALEGGARVEEGEWTVEDALPGASTCFPARSAEAYARSQDSCGSGRDGGKRKES